VKYGCFIDEEKAFAITEPLTPRPWINYIGNRKLNAFISQNAGGLLWYLEPYTRRITRYHYLPAPGDRPGFYVYIKDRKTGEVWNPHFAPVCADLDLYECRHEPGITSFTGEKDGIKVEVSYGMPPEDTVMLWKVKVSNTGEEDAEIMSSSYLEFGLLEFMREALGWCYLKSHFSLDFDPELNAVRYDYHVFEAPDTPAMAFACNTEISGFEASREAFVGRTGTLERPNSLFKAGKLSNSELPQGGQACAVLGVDMKLAPGESKEFAYIFALDENWDGVAKLIKKYREQEQVEKGFAQTRNFWAERLETFQVESPDKGFDRFVNTWGAYNSVSTLQYARMISTDHMGTDGLRYRDTTQDALAVANLEPAYSLSRMEQVFEQQTQDGGGCMSFYPHTSMATTDYPHRSDNTVWPVYTIKNYMAETGDFSVLDRQIKYRDQGEDNIYEHMLNGLKHIYDRRGPNGLPTMFYADWNDSLAMFADKDAESVMLGQQMVYSCKEFIELAELKNKPEDVQWCREVASELSAIINSDKVWDGEWYRRLLLSNGKLLGSSSCAQGQIYLNAQSWAVISGIADFENRGQVAMDAVKRKLDTEFGVAILTPPFAGFPEPEDPPKGSNPGIGENGGIFCHANTWAIIAECLLGNNDRAFKYYRQLLPESIIAKVGEEHYEREPYVYVSSIVGPSSERLGQGGISWLTGTASWMYIAATQYLLGIRPVLDGLQVKPCLPKDIGTLKIKRKFRACEYDIKIVNQGSGKLVLEQDGKVLDGCLIKPSSKDKSQVICHC
jgi:cellobiose phosphorylase